MQASPNLPDGVTLFRVHREKVAGETVRVLLEPIANHHTVEVEDGDEFITGTLTVDPWKD